MLIEVNWYDPEKTMLLFKFLPGYSWDDLAAAMQTGQQMMSEMPHRVDWIYYGGEGSKQTIPRGNPWHMLRAASQKIPANTGKLCVVNPGMFVNLMQKIGESTIPQAMRLMRSAPTLEAAVDLLKRERQDGNNVGG